jgi:amino acid adenylation domain-containing protein
MRSISDDGTELTAKQKRSLLGEMIGGSAQEVELYPLSIAQQRLWFLEQLKPRTSSSQICSGLRLIGDLDLHALQYAVASVLARHETLRTAFITLGGDVSQRISANADVEIPTIDFRALPDKVREREAYDAARAEVRRPFDLQSSPLLRLRLIRMGSDDHILLFAMHHLVSDAWSIGVFVEELMEFYESQTEGRECRLPKISVQYADFTRWQRERLSGEELDRQIQYWKARLAGVPSLLELPGDGVRPAEQSFDCEVLSVRLPAPTVGALKALAKQEDTTLFTVLLTAFKVLLYRYSNQEDICVGVPVAGRSHVETEALIGLFVNTLVIRTEMSGNPPFRDLLAQVREVLLEAHSYQDLPFEKVVEEVQPTRSLAYNPLFQVMMTAVKDPLHVRRFGSLKASPYVVNSSTSNLDLTAFVVEAADGTLWWRLEYNIAMFAQARIQRMIGHFQKLLSSIVENPERRIGDLPLLTSEELEQLSAWNNNVAKYPQTCVHTLIADQSARSPDRVAVVFDNHQLTYSELDHLARQVAAALRAAGAALGSRIAICLERSLEMIVGVLGILQTGAAYVPLDPVHPVERLSDMAEDAGADLLLTQRNLIARLPQAFRRCVLIEDALTMPPGDPPEPQDPESLAYVIFTSGSTGRPKGVAVPHRAIVNLLSSMHREPGLALDDRFLAVTNPCFDISALELFWPLVTGARCVIATQDAVVDGSKLLKNLKRHGITTMQATPSTWRLLIGAGWNRSTCELKVLCGGETLPADLANELLERSDSVWNLYGPTETTIWSSLSRVQEHCPITIGRPIQNTQFYVLDRRMRRVPVGIPGELYIGGDGLAKGYLNRSGLNNERFLPHPFNSAGGRLYRTGDEVRYRADGEIEYLGRLDSQAKVRGFRIELGEVEAVVKQQAGIGQAVAIVREDTVGDQRLVCYAVPKPGAKVSASVIRASVKSRLPDYMVPTLVLLDDLPLSVNGKVDRARLPAPTEDRRGGGRPRDTFEKRLLLIWRKVLRLDGIGIKDNFFELGGHSLLAMQLLAEVERVFERRLPVATVFGAQTVEQMAAVISRYSAKPVSSLVALRERGNKPPLFVIPLPDGNPLAYVDLARFLGTDQPIYVLQYLGYEGNGKPLEQIEAIAEQFLMEIRKVQRVGPYQLAGFCMGGLVAFEMAQQLVAQGEEAPLLVLVGTGHPSSIPPIEAIPAALHPFIFLLRGLGRHFGAMLRLRPREAFRYFRRKSAIVKEMVYHRDIYRPKRYRQSVFEANYRAGSRYFPLPFPGRIVLFLTGDEQTENATDTSLVWCELAREGCAVCRNPASDFWELLRKPHVKAFADNLTDRMREWHTLVAARFMD